MIAFAILPRHPDPKVSVRSRRLMFPSVTALYLLNHWFCLGFSYVTVLLLPAWIRIRKMTAPGEQNFSRLRKAGHTVTRCQLNLISHYIRFISVLVSEIVSPGDHRLVTLVKGQTETVWWRARRSEPASFLFEAERCRCTTTANQGDQYGGAGEGFSPSTPHKRRYLPPTTARFAAELLTSCDLEQRVPTINPIETAHRPAPQSPPLTSHQSARGQRGGCPVAPSERGGVPRFSPRRAADAPVRVVLTLPGSFREQPETQTAAVKQRVGGAGRWGMGADFWF